jgi:hypothetical protein
LINVPLSLVVEELLLAIVVVLVLKVGLTITPSLVVSDGVLWTVVLVSLGIVAIVFVSERLRDIIFITITTELIWLGVLKLFSTVVLVHLGPLKLLLQSVVFLLLTKIVVSLVASLMAMLLFLHIITRLVKLLIMSEGLITFATLYRLFKSLLEEPLFFNLSFDASHLHILDKVLHIAELRLQIFIVLSLLVVDRLQPSDVRNRLLDDASIL